MVRKPIQNFPSYTNITMHHQGQQRVETTKPSITKVCIAKKAGHFHKLPPNDVVFGPHQLPHLNSRGAPKLTEEQKKERKKIQNRQAQQRRRDKKRLLYPVYRLCSKEEVKTSGLKSWLIIHAETRKYVLHLANWEIYSSKLGSVYMHGREVQDRDGMNGPTRPPTKRQYKVDNGHWTEIADNTVQSLDNKNDMLHVVREGALILHKMACDPTIYDNPLQNGTLNINFSLLINGLMTKGVGKPDNTRSPHSWRIVFGFNEYGTPTGFGKVQDHLGAYADAFIKEVGRVAELLSATMQSMQISSGNIRILTNAARDWLYAAKLRNRFGLKSFSPMRHEMIAVCTMKVHPTCPLNKMHLDVKNPEDPRYNRNGAFSAIVTDEKGQLHLFQVLVASRRYAITLGMKGIY